MMENKQASSTLRLKFPQWQGGNNYIHYFGSQLLEWLAPESNDETIEVPIDVEPTNDEKEDGIFAKQQLINQTNAALNILHKRQPDRIVVFGGDCSADLAPFAYLLEKYKNEVAILWIDAHPDINTPEIMPYYNSMVLASLLGEGDPEFASLVPVKADPANVLFAGINDEDEMDRPVYQKFNFSNVNTTDFASSSRKVLDLLKAIGVSRVAIHFDLDVLDFQEFRSIRPARPDIYDKCVQELHKGATMQSVVQLIQDVAEEFDVVGLGITEYMPWDSMALSKMLSSLPLLKK